MIQVRPSPWQVLSVLIASILIDFIGVGIVMPLLPFYGQFFGASAWQVGLLLGLFPLMGIFAPTLWGSISDRAGRRTALLFNIAGTTLSYLILSLANSLGMLFIARILAGASSSSIVIARSYAADLTTPETRTKTLSWLEAATGIGYIIGPAISILLLGRDPTNPNFRLPGLAATATSGLTFCIALITLPRSHQHPATSNLTTRFSIDHLIANNRNIFKRPLIGSLFGLVFITYMAIMSIQTIMALWCEARFGWGVQQFGYFVILYCLGIVITHIGLTGKLARKLGDPTLCLWGLMTGALGILIVAFSTTVVQLAVGMILIILAEAAIPSLVSLLSQLSGAQQQGQTLGLMQSVSGLARFLGAIWAGFLFETQGENWPYWCSSALMVIGAIICWQQISQTQFSTIMRDRRQTKFMHLFEVLDSNKSGTLELQDFEQAGQLLAQRRGLQPDTAEYDLLLLSFIGFGKLLQQLADQDGNHKIDPQEWLLCLEHQIDYDFGSLFLQLIDINQDGAVTLAELRSFYHAYNINTDELEATFHSFKLNPEGNLSATEFKAIFGQFLYGYDVQAPGNWLLGSSLAKQL